MRYIFENNRGMKLTSSTGINRNASRIPFPHSVVAILNTRRIKPNFPMPPKGPSVGTSLQGPWSRNPAMPLEAVKTELIKVARKKAPFESILDGGNISITFSSTSSVKGLNVKPVSLEPKRHQSTNMIWTWGTASSIGSAI